MRIPTNKISSIIKFYRKELKELYNPGEIENFIFYSFNEYLGLSRAELVTKSDNKVSESELLKFNNVVKLLKKHKPIQYILESAYFYGLKLYVDENVLIPRQETEELVDLIINDREQGSTKSIIDIGTGSGCIAIALKKHLPGNPVAAIDISPEALEIAQRNAITNNVKIDFQLKDILRYSTIQQFNNFDIIVSNPPYVLDSEKNMMDKNVLEYEPHLALFVNDSDPLLYYKAIADFALKHLNSSGKLYFEINEAMGDQTKDLLKKKGFKNVILKKDISGKNRILYCRK